MTDERTRIFIVDDHPLVREWLGALLKQQPDLEICGYADEVGAALAAMIAEPPDVAIVDLSLRSSSGLDLIKDLAEHLPGTKVIVLSMHEEVFYVERAIRAGARGYVMKRESTDNMIEAIRVVRTGRLYANAQLLARLTDRALARGPQTTANPVELLSDRELDVFQRLGDGQATRRIADELHVSIKTIQAYCARIKEKLAIANGAELVREAVRWTEKQHRP